ncbi:M23 family metallopeptidase [Methylibium sp.]|uniref:M23 family metallopeptidase n=1 Tax=Methylibium sp. TaxID=2067992 RepID=UPI003D111858
MQIIVTHGRYARTRALDLPAWKLTIVLTFLVALLLALSGAIYHFVFLKAAREGWPVVSQVVKLVVRDEIAQRDRFMRENLDAMASKVGEMQAKLMKLESMGERVSGLAGLKPEDFRGLDRPSPAPSGSALGDGRGGPYLPVESPSMVQLNQAIAALDEGADRRSDVFTLVESRLLETRLRALMVPSSAPVDGPVGSGFGFRTDPFTGRGALHTGLDFPADTGTPILAAAGGVVLSAETHPAYGRTVELDHGNGLVTRYAHAAKLLVAPGDLIRRGQKIAEVGSTGRSTGPHLHFEVLVDGAPQDPAKFLAQAGRLPANSVARATTHAAQAR